MDVERASVEDNLYEFGLATAFCFWLFYAVRIVVAVNSVHERNLNKVGFRLSWATLQVKQLTKPKKDTPAWHGVLKYVLIVGTALPFVLLSWGYVALQVASLLYHFTKSAGEPQSVKEFRWRLRNFDMGVDQICAGLMAISGVEGSVEEYRNQIFADMAERGLR